MRAVLALRHTVLALAVATSFTAVACSGEGPEPVADHHDDGASEEENVGVASSALVATDTVNTAVTQSCSTTAVKGLSTQLIELVQCLRPNTFMRIDKTPGLALGAAVFPYLQTNAAKQLIAAQKARGVTMSINSGLRALPQQFLLYRWYQTGRCGIPLAARPGTSNHESALAIDINDNAGWRSALQGKSFRWLGANDPVHYDFIGGGTADLRGLSVKAFQMLWNRNHPEDKIAEDGAYGPATADRLARSPIGGFPKGALCPAADAGTDAGSSPDDSQPMNEVPEIPDATESGDEDPAPAASPEQGGGTSGPTRLTPNAIEGGGCNAGPTKDATSASAFGVVLGAAVVVAARRRRRKSA